MPIVFPADESHYPVIREIAYQTWPVAYGEILSPKQMKYMLEMFYEVDSIREQVDNRGHKFLIAKEDENYPGFASYELDCKQPGYTKLHKLYVLPEYQGTGLGKLLLDAVKEAAGAARNTHLFLNVNRFNKAVEFYKRYGFYISYEEDIDIGRGYLMEDYVMKMEI